MRSRPAAAESSRLAPRASSMRSISRGSSGTSGMPAVVREPASRWKSLSLGSIGCAAPKSQSGLDGGRQALGRRPVAPGQGDLLPGRLVEDGAIELFLAPEVVVKGRDIHAGPGGHLARRGAGETRRGETLFGGVQDVAPRLDGIAATGPSDVSSPSHRSSPPRIARAFVKGDREESSFRLDPGGRAERGRPGRRRRSPARARHGPGRRARGRGSGRAASPARPWPRSAKTRSSSSRST